MDTQDKKPAVQEKIASLGTGVNALDTFGMIVFFVVIVEIVLLIGLNIYEKSRIDKLTTEINTTSGVLNSADYKTINDQISDVIVGSDQLKVALNKRVPWSKMFTMINAVTPKNVKINSLSINETGTFKADGETTSLSSLADAMVAWKDGVGSVESPFSTVTLGGNGYTGDALSRKVTFSISGQIDVNLLKEQK